MPTVTFETSALGPGRSVERAAGGRLLDLCDDVGAPIAFACRSADCGTCRVDVSEGAGHLTPAEADEALVLARCGAPSSHRLACQAHLRPGSGRVVLRWIAD